MKVHQLQKAKLIRNIFPIHDSDELKRLETSWYKNSSSYFKMKSLPTSRIFYLRLHFYLFFPICLFNSKKISDQIRNYFGESVTFYFSFYEFYNLSLLPIVIVGNLIFHWSIFCLLKQQEKLEIQLQVSYHGLCHSIHLQDLQYVVFSI